MFTDDRPTNVERIEERLLAAIDHDFDSLEDTFTALVMVFTFQMAQACPDCRKNIAKKLRQFLPQMLADANRLAATAEPREHKHLQ